MHFVGEDSQKGLLSFKNNMLITTHHAAGHEHVGVRNRCLIQRGSPGLSPPELRGSQTICATVRGSESQQCGLGVHVHFNHLTIFATWVLNDCSFWIFMRWSEAASSRAQGLLGYLLLGCMHWKKFNKSGVIHIHKHTVPKTWLKCQSGPEPFQAPVRNLKFPK